VFNLFFVGSVKQLKKLIINVAAVVKVSNYKLKLKLIHMY